MPTRQADAGSTQGEASSGTAPIAGAALEEQEGRRTPASDEEMPNPEEREERIAQMQREAYEVERKQEYHRLLRFKENGYLSTQSNPSSRRDDSREPQFNRRGVSPLQAEIEAKRRKTIRDEEKDIPLPSVKEYKGESYKEFRDWERQLKVCFETRPTAFDRDSQKVRFARGKLTGTAGEAWTRLDQGQSYSWEEFIQFLKKQITSDAGAALGDLTGWCNCKQGTRTVSAIVNEIDDFESRMEKFPETTRINILVLAMRASLRKELMRNGVLPATREAAIAQAMTLETAEQEDRRRDAGAPLGRNPSSWKWTASGKNTTKPVPYPASGANVELPRSAYATESFSARVPLPPNTERKKNATCHYCNRKGHYQAECRKMAAETTQARQVKESGS